MQVQLRQLLGRVGESRAAPVSPEVMPAPADDDLLADGDVASACLAWDACFDQGGNFVVVVEERSESPASNVEGAVAEAKRTRFEVWSVLLCQWSPVFEKMLGSDNFVESQKAEVVIKDFSARAVGIFLRFLYSGLLQGCASILVEVAAMADKYQVQPLHDLCLQTVRKALKPHLACKIFDAADCFKIEDLSLEAREQILIHPTEALKMRPALRPELLEEILDSRLLCLDDEALSRILAGWGRKQDDRLQPIIDARITRPFTGRKPGEYTENVLYTLWQRYLKAGKKGAFLWLLGGGDSGATAGVDGFGNCE